MDRLIAGANFIHANMPEWHRVAEPSTVGPRRLGRGRLVPGPGARTEGQTSTATGRWALEKPVDSGYGPYADELPQEQHRLGPFTPIRVRIRELLAPPASARPPSSP